MEIKSYDEMTIEEKNLWSECCEAVNSWIRPDDITYVQQIGDLYRKRVAEGALNKKVGYVNLLVEPDGSVISSRVFSTEKEALMNSERPAIGLVRAVRIMYSK